jgi:ribosome biogenesis GTPase A
LKKLSEERKNNKKSDDVVLRTLDIFQPLFETPEELIVRELTEECDLHTNEEGVYNKPSAGNKST